MENQTPPMIHKKIIAVLKEIKAIGKTNTNTQQNFKFRGIDDMYNAVHPLFQKHGIFITSDILNQTITERDTKSGGKLIHTYIDGKFTFYAEDGSSVASNMRGEAMDTGDKGTNKAMSVALKYALIQMFLIPTQEMKSLDTDKESPQIAATSEKKKEPEVQNLNAMTDVDKKQISDELKLLTTEKEVWDYMFQWVKYKDNLIFKGMCQKQISSLPPAAKMTPAQRKSYKQPTTKK